MSGGVTGVWLGRGGKSAGDYAAGVKKTAMRRRQCLNES